jgi:hypothetical protein
MRGESRQNENCEPRAPGNATIPFFQTDPPNVA